MLPPIFHMVRLSKRLAAVAGCVEKNSTVIDVGTDHGLVPVWLVQAGIAGKVYATDLKPGPLHRAGELVRETETEEFIKLCICDGLDGFGAADADTVIVSGMGGENIAGILSRALWTKDGVHLILQPQSKNDTLRRFLLENGYTVQSEHLVEDTGRFYQILCACGGKGEAYTEAELYTGRFEQVRDEPLLSSYLEHLSARVRKAAPYDEKARGLSRQYNEMKMRLYRDKDM